MTNANVLNDKKLLASAVVSLLKTGKPWQPKGGKGQRCRVPIMVDVDDAMINKSLIVLTAEHFRKLASPSLAGLPPFTTPL